MNSPLKLKLILLNNINTAFQNGCKLAPWYRLFIAPPQDASVFQHYLGLGPMWLTESAAVQTHMHIINAKLGKLFISLQKIKNKK